MYDTPIDKRLVIMNNRGFSLVELIVVMAVFIIVIMITSDAFNTILKQSMKLSSSEESNIEGVIGLELFRHDLEQAGYGLPSSFQSTLPVYSEIDGSISPGSLYNDSSTASRLPRALVAGNNRDSVNIDGIGTLNDKSDYLAIKATTVGLSPASQRWTYVSYSSAKRPPKQWPSGNLVAGDSVIMLRRSFTETGTTNQLVYDTADPEVFSASYAADGFLAPFAPQLQQEIYYIYGVGSGTLRMPFNRADYFVARPDKNVPARCAPNAGILYKAVVDHADGNLIPVPLLDCVADMQVVFGWDTDGDDIADTSSNADGSSVTGTASAGTIQGLMGNADSIRAMLKFVKVYILAQDGRRDANYANPSSSIIVGDTAEIALTKNFDLTAGGTVADWQRYRWKVYRIVVKPKNLIATN